MNGLVGVTSSAMRVFILDYTLFWRYYNLFFNVDIFKVLATKHAIFKFYGSLLREGNKTAKLRVIAVTQGNDSQPFSCCQKTVTRKNWGSLPWLMATTLNFFCCQKECDKKKLRVAAVTHGDNLNKFLLPDDQKKLRVVVLNPGNDPQFCCFDRFL